LYQSDFSNGFTIRPRGKSPDHPLSGIDGPAIFRSAREGDCVDSISGEFLEFLFDVGLLFRCAFRIHCQQDVAA
jgi:hypothetical protein